MIDEKTCKSQLDRIAHLQGFPKLAAGVRDMICALQAASSEAIAKGVIDEWIGSVTAEHPVCPMAGDLRRLAYEANEKRATEAHDRRKECGVCFGTGWEIVKRGGLSGARRCPSCGTPLTA